jgi:hypothetical protein
MKDLKNFEPCLVAFLNSAATPGNCAQHLEDFYFDSLSSKISYEREKFDDFLALRDFLIGLDRALMDRYASKGKKKFKKKRKKKAKTVRQKKELLNQDFLMSEAPF